MINGLLSEVSKTIIWDILRKIIPPIFGGPSHGFSKKKKQQVFENYSDIRRDTMSKKTPWDEYSVCFGILKSWEKIDCNKYNIKI